ncbi:putative pentatricopeptide repeat-containing protein [Iris pallida]|uniref:Pentatricopeptide repeat-containing protein n=1 Tax=Iris pallida TaxID=29817 RepID=A0AAX6IE28_IRIPA|nr:putative pentatricopeptide repeat-containing protein [Iris pallida]
MASTSTVRWPRVLTPSHMVQLIKQQKNPLSALHLFNAATLLYPSSVYSHTSSVYSAIIDSLSSSPTATHHLPSLLRRMSLSSSPARDASFSRAILSLSRSGHHHLSLSLLRLLPSSNCPRWPLSLHAALKSLLARDEFLTAHRLLDKMPHRTPLTLPSLNLLMDSLCRIDRPDLALQIFAEIGHHCCYPDRDSYRILMRGLCNAGMLNDAIHLLYSMLWRVSQKGCEADVTVYRTLLESLCRDGRVRDAEEVLGKVLLKGLRSPGRRRAFRKPDLEGLDAEEMRRRISEALVVGGVRSLKSYAAMVVDLYGEGRIYDADKMFDEMVGKGFQPTVPMYEAKVEGLCREGKVGDATRVVEVEMKERGCVPRVRTYELVMEAFCKEGKSRRAVEWLERMERQVGCVARKETFEILVDGLLMEGLFSEAASVLERMARRKYWPGEEMYSRVIEGLCTVGRRYEALLWLEEMASQGKVPGVRIWRLLVPSVCLDHDQAEIISCLDHITDEWVENPNSIAE